MLVYLSEIPCLNLRESCFREKLAVHEYAAADMTDNKQPDPAEASLFERSLGVFRYTSRAIELVWTTSRPLTFALAALTVIAGILPAAIAWVGKLIVDGVVAAAAQETPDPMPVLWLVALEAVIVIALAGCQRGLSASQSLLRALLGQRVNVMILEKALTLELAHFEDSEFYDKLTQARREASSRPLSLVTRTFGLVQNAITLSSYAVLLFAFSPWAVVILIGAGLPSFFAEAKFSGDAFRLFRWRSPDTRMQMYLETVIAREDGVKEVKLFQLGPKLLQRYRAIFKKIVCRGPGAHDSARHLGIPARPCCISGILRRIRLDRARDDLRPHHTWRDDDVPRAVSPGAVRGVGHPDVDQRYVRGQPVSIQPV